MSRDEFDLDRFVVAQAHTYAPALAELTAGRKRSHWIWFIFPQLSGLGVSTMSQAYGLSSLAEARAYLAHPLLGPRLIECVQAMIGHAGTAAQTILSEVDGLKFRSCITLFAAAGGLDSVFGQALQIFYAGQPDPKTVTLLKQAGEAFAAFGVHSTSSPSASDLIDQKISEIGDWRGSTLSKIRTLIKEAIPDVVEEWKWMGTPVWSRDGIICTGETYKSKVKLTFAKGAMLKDPTQLFNSSLDGKVRRAIDIQEGQAIDTQAFKELIRAAAALNASVQIAKTQRAK